MGVEPVSKRRRTKRKSCDTSIEIKSETQQKDPNFGWHPDHKSVQQSPHPPDTDILLSLFRPNKMLSYNISIKCGVVDS